MYHIKLRAETLLYIFLDIKLADNLFATMRVPSDCGSTLTSFIFWQLLRDEENTGVGHDYHVLSFARSGHVLKGVVNVSDEINRVKEDLGLPDIGYSSEQVDIASIARGAEALIGSDDFNQSDDCLSGLGIDGLAELLDSIEVEAQLALGLDEC